MFHVTVTILSRNTVIFFTSGIMYMITIFSVSGSEKFHLNSSGPYAFADSIPSSACVCALDVFTVNNENLQRVLEFIYCYR